MPRTVQYWLKAINHYLASTKRFEAHIKQMKPVLMENGKYRAELLIGDGHVDKNRQFYPSLSVTLIDIASSHALLSVGDGLAAVSTNLHVTNIQPAFFGDMLSIDAAIRKIDDSIVHIDAEISSTNGKLIARGIHTLFLTPMRFELPDEDELCK